MSNILLIGNGHWGRNYVSTLADFPDVSLQIATRHNWKSLLDEQPDGVIIATPPQSHIDIAHYALERNVPVMVEKPLALSLNEIKILDRFSAPILVNHQHIFAPAFLKLREIVLSWDRIDGIFTRGYGNGPFRDYSSLFDYGSHDLSMCFALLNNQTSIDYAARMPSWHSQGEIFDLHLNIGGVRVSAQIGNGAQNKSRYFEVFGGKETIIYDDIREDKLIHNGKVVKIDRTLPLASSIETFLQLIDGKKDWRSGLELSKMIIDTLERADLSLHSEEKRMHLLLGDE
jgi:predicted dehydrogenase